ncbi:MAG: Mur ligase domain-containing protein [Candidatus Limnocylindrales bacterium]
MSEPRGAASVGSGLAPARDARPIREGERIHVVGAGGAGASAAALLAHQAGAVVSGCDAGGPSPYTPPLETAGIRLDWEHSPEHVTRRPAPERLAVTKALTAVDPNNAELAAARAAAVPLEPWQQVIADAAVGRTLVGVAGTHGKSTTSGWLVHVLVEAGLDPCALPPANRRALGPDRSCAGRDTPENSWDPRCGRASIPDRRIRAHCGRSRESPIRHETPAD